MNFIPIFCLPTIVIYLPRINTSLKFGWERYRFILRNIEIRQCVGTEHLLLLINLFLLEINKFSLIFSYGARAAAASAARTAAQPGAYRPPAWHVPAPAAWPGPSAWQVAGNGRVARPGLCSQPPWDPGPLTLPRNAWRPLQFPFPFTLQNASIRCVEKRQLRAGRNPQLSL